MTIGFENFGAKKQHRLFIGDALEGVKLLDDEIVRLTATSPPYWNVKDYGVEGQLGHGKGLREYLDYMRDLATELLRVTAPNGKAAINTAAIPASKEHGTDPMLIDSGRSRVVDLPSFIQREFLEAGWELSNIIIWDKRKYNNQRIFGSYPYPPNFFSHISFEMIHVFRKPGDPPKGEVSEEDKEASILTMEEWSDWCFDSIWDIAPVIKFHGNDINALEHDAPYPTEIPDRLMRMFSCVGDTILEPLVGTGTTLGVANLLGRRGIGIELDPNLADMIQLRTVNLQLDAKDVKTKRQHVTLDFFSGDNDPAVAAEYDGTDRAGHEEE